MLKTYHPYLSRVSYYEFCLAVPDCFHNFNGDYGMSLRGVRANDKYAVSVSDFSDGVGHGAAAECCDQTGHGRRMSETGAMVDIVGADNGPGKFLHQVVFFVGAFG